MCAFVGTTESIVLACDLHPKSVSTIEYGSLFKF